MEVKLLESEEEATQVVELFSENNNLYNWSLEKWKHFYQNYPEGKPVSFIAVEKGNIVGHYGLLPVVIGGFSSYLGLHAYVATAFRPNGLFVLANIFNKIDSYCQNKGVRFICSFPNPRFSTIITKIFNWKEIINLFFDTAKKYNFNSMKSKKFFFQYSSEWYNWRFGENKSFYISKYYHSCRSRFQILKSNYECINSLNLGLPCLEFWNPDKYSCNRKDQFTQPFSVKIYDQKFDKIFNIDKWFIEMGDSDTFVYNPI